MRDQNSTGISILWYPAQDGSSGYEGLKEPQQLQFILYLY